MRLMYGSYAPADGCAVARYMSGFGHSRTHIVPMGS